MRNAIAVLAVLAMVSPLMAGSVIQEDFNSGVFTLATTSRPTTGTDPIVYTWGGIGDEFDGWVSLTEGGSVTPTGAEIYLNEVRTGLHPSSNSFAYGDTSDGNLVAWYAKQNDVPKSGFEFTTVLDPAMGGGRDDDGNAQAFVLIYDAELAYISGSRGAVGKANAVVSIDGATTDASSPRFYRETNPENGTPYDFTFTPNADDVSVEDLATGVRLDTSDGSAAAAIRGWSSGVIEQTVADGAPIGVKFLNNRYGEKTNTVKDDQGNVLVGSNWQNMATAVDNVHLAVLEYGDANGDLDVDIFQLDGNGDAQILLANLGTGSTWSEGDFNGDGDVDIFQLDQRGDAQLLLANLPGDVPAGTAAATYDYTTGEVIVEVGSDVQLIGIESIGNVVQGLSPEIDGEGPAQYDEDTVAWFTLTALGEGTYNLGAILPTDLTADDIGFGYNTSIAEVTVVPEPATMSLLALGGLVAIRRRRRK
ncbi:MAG: PEP-CTERM sorting domain-containing protein [Phycisphaerae bacterium]